MAGVVRLHSLQYLRAFAALAVVYSHAVQQHDVFKPWLPYYGDVGVDVFFVISGFVISGFVMVWIARDSDTPANFFNKRLRRVVPLYWFFTFLMALLFFLLPSAFRGTELGLNQLIQSLLFIPHWSVGHEGKVWPLVVPGWSLNYEMFFYLVFALSLWLPSAWRVGVTCLVIVAVFTLANLSPTGTAIQAFLKQSIMLEFILGMLLALCFKRWPSSSRFLGWMATLVGVLFLVLQPMFFSEALPRVIQFGFPALFIVAGFLYLPMVKSRFGLLLGDSSYALYLSHTLVLGGLRVVLPIHYFGNGPIAAWAYLMTALVVCVVAGIVVHYIIDNWLLKMQRLSFLRAYPKAKVSH